MKKHVISAFAAACLLLFTSVRADNLSVSGASYGRYDFRTIKNLILKKSDYSFETLDINGNSKINVLDLCRMKSVSIYGDIETTTTTTTTSTTTSTTTKPPITTTSTTTTTSVSVPLSEMDSKARDMIYTKINTLRQSAGLNKLDINGILQDAAKQRALDLVTLYSHLRPNGDSFTSLFKQLNAWSSCQLYNCSATSYEKVYNNISQAQEQYLKGNYTDIGVGVHYEPNKTYKYYVSIIMIR